MLGAFVAALALSSLASGQGSTAALQFFGTGANQQDRVRIRLDDDAGGPDASTPCDVGVGSFTLQFWVRGLLAENDAPSSGAQGSYDDARWLSSPCVLDRGVLSGTGRTFGVSLAGGRVRFGTGTGDGPMFDVANTLEGDVFVLDGLWHHVSVSRDLDTRRKMIFVDGQLDVAGPAGVSSADLSYPDAGVPGSGSAYGPFLVVGAAKDDIGPARPSFRGRIDELYVWNRTRRGSEVLTDLLRVVPAGSAGLVGAYRFEEGLGTIVRDTSGAGSADGQLVAGVPGNGAWTLLANGANEVAPVTAPSLPDGFSRQTIVGGLAEPTSMAFTPDGRILVTLRLGEVRVVRNGALLAAPALTVPVNSAAGERGLLSIALDPDFATNGWFYVYATNAEPRNRLVRYTLVGDVANPLSAYVVWEDPDLAGTTHQGGGLVFGQDGYVYLTTGEAGSGASSQNLGGEHGKVLRFAKDGSIPADNPFVGVAGARPAIWALGLRNPFRLIADPADGSLWIGDVGGNSPTAFEELNRLARGANYGWPAQEGTTCYAASCTGITFPIWTYAHDDPAFSAVTGGGCIVAGAFYRATQFPAEYRGNLFVGDYGNRWTRRLVFDAAGHVIAAPVFDPQPGAGPIVDLDVGPDGALYTLTYGAGSSGSPESARIVRIAWTGSNQPPVAVASASNANGPAPLAVQFTGSGSSDPDQGPGALQFTWDFGDGTSSTLPDPAHVYATQGAFEARLSVSDGALSTASAPVIVRVGTPPVVRLSVPAAAQAYRAGDVIAFEGGAKDAEDGPLPPSALTWQVVLVHLAHTHPFLGPVSGLAGGSFQIPITGHEPAETHYVVRLIARDSSGLESEGSVELRPTIAPVVFNTKPAGIPLTVDGAPQPTPYAFDGLAGFVHDLEAPATRLVGGILHEFRRWSDGSTARSRTWTTPAAGGRATAEYVALTTTSAVVAAVDRNAQYETALGQLAGESGDGQRLAFGRDVGGRVEAGFEFQLAIPRGARIVAATLETRAAVTSADAVDAQIRAYDVASAPAFVFGSTVPLTAHAPLSAVSVGWAPGPWTQGDLVVSPDLAALVQGVVARSDWSPGNVLGLVIEPTPTAPRGARRVRNFASGNAPRLVVHWAPAAPSVGGGH